MYSHQDQLAAATHVHLERVLTLANAAITSTESLAALNLTAGQTVLADMVSNMKVLAGAKDFPEFIVLHAAMLGPAVEKSIDYSRSGYELTLQANEEAARLIKIRFAEVGQKVVDSLTKTAQNASVGSLVVGAPGKSVSEQSGKAARPLVDIAETSAAAAKKPARTPKPKARKMA